LVRNDFDRPSMSIGRAVKPGYFFGSTMKAVTPLGAGPSGSVLASRMPASHSFGHRCPHLGAVEPVDVAVAPGDRLHRAERVRAAAGFRERHHADDLAGNQPRHVGTESARACRPDRCRWGRCRTAGWSRRQSECRCARSPRRWPRTQRIRRPCRRPTPGTASHRNPPRRPCGSARAGNSPRASYWSITGRTSVFMKRADAFANGRDFLGAAYRPCLRFPLRDGPRAAHA